MSSICNGLGKRKNFECTDTEKGEGHSCSQWKGIDPKHAQEVAVCKKERESRILNLSRRN